MFGLFASLFLLAFVLRAYHPVGRTDKKLERARVFTNELLRGHWVGTYRQPHPGVTMMTASGLTVQLYQYLDGSPAQELLSWAVPSFVTDFGERMAIGVFGLAIVLAALIVAIALTLRKMAGLRLALAGTGLLTFSPFYLAQSRIVQSDALLGTFMLLSALLLLACLQTGQRWYLLLSGFAGGLALLSKSPALFLLPYSALALLVHLALRVRDERATYAEGGIRRLLGEAGKDLLVPLALWVILAASAFALWPAMWARPVDTLARVFAFAETTVARPHQHQMFFLGRVYTGTNLGILYYPITIAFNSTFITTTLCVVAIGHYTLWRKRVTPPLRPHYALPDYLMLELIAAVGLVGLADIVGEAMATVRPRLGQTLPGAMIGVGLGLQALVALPFAPDYGAHHNYLLGGNRVAVQMVQVGDRNEGMLHIARYLHLQEDLESKSLSTAFPLNESVIQYFPGITEYGGLAGMDYFLFSRAMLQRRIATENWEPAWERYRDQTPQAVVRFDGVDYLWLYASKPAESGPPVAIERGWNGFIVVAWLWTAGLVAVLAWALRRDPPQHASTVESAV